MTEQEISAKEAELSAKYECEVKSIVLKGNGDDTFVGFRKPSSLALKKHAVNKMFSSEGSIDIDAGDVILQGTLIPEESCKEMQLGSDNHSVYLGACLACLEDVKIFSAVLKKK